MVTSEGRIKIADFGIAKAIDSAGSDLTFKTMTGMFCGTPTYSAPEQAMGTDVGPPADLYSLGIISYELLSGRVPFADPTETPVRILLRHVNDPVPSLQTLNPGLDTRIVRWVERLLEKEVEKRPENAQVAWNELEEIVLGLVGPMWRREGRLLTTTTAAGATRLLTPAAFDPTVKAGASPPPRPAAGLEGATVKAGAGETALDGSSGDAAVAAPPAAAPPSEGRHVPQEPAGHRHPRRRRRAGRGRRRRRAAHAGRRLRARERRVELPHRRTRKLNAARRWRPCNPGEPDGERLRGRRGVRGGDLACADRLDRLFLAQRGEWPHLRGKRGREHLRARPRERRATLALRNGGGGALLAQGRGRGRLRRQRGHAPLRARRRHRREAVALPDGRGRSVLPGRRRRRRLLRLEGQQRVRARRSHRRGEVALRDGRGGVVVAGCRERLGLHREQRPQPLRPGRHRTVESNGASRRKAS